MTGQIPLAASVQFHGVLAVIIILVIVAVVVLGVVSFLRLSARGARKAVGKVPGRNRRGGGPR